MSETSTGSSAAANHSCNTNGNQTKTDSTSSAIAVPGQAGSLSVPNTLHPSAKACGQIGMNHAPQQLIEEEQLDTASALAVAMTNGKRENKF